jgi:hypothetical protein
LNALDGGDHVGTGLALNVDDDGGRALIPAADLGVLQAVDHLGHVLDEHRSLVAIGHHHVAIGAGGGDLVVGGDRVGLVRAVERAFGARHIGADDHVAQVLHGDSVAGEPRQIGLDADRRPQVSLHRDPPHAAELAQPLGEQAVGEIAELPQRDGARRERQRHDRGVGRVDLGIVRRIRQRPRQRRSGRIDAGLHVLGSRIDVAGEIELQGDLADPE